MSRPRWCWWVKVPVHTWLRCFCWSTASLRCENLWKETVGKHGSCWCFLVAFRCWKNMWENLAMDGVSVVFGEMPVFEGQNHLNDLGIASLSQAKHTAEGKEFTDNWSVKDISDIRNGWSESPKRSMSKVKMCLRDSFTYSTCAGYFSWIFPHVRRYLCIRIPCQMEISPSPRGKISTPTRVHRVLNAMGGINHQNIGDILVTNIGDILYWMLYWALLTLLNDI